MLRRLHAGALVLLVEDEQVEFAVGHAQRVAEGVNFEIHRNTWRYSVVIEQQPAAKMRCVAPPSTRWLGAPCLRVGACRSSLRAAS